MARLGSSGHPSGNCGSRMIGEEGGDCERGWLPLSLPTGVGDGERWRGTFRGGDEGGCTHVGSLAEALVDGCCESMTYLWLLVTRVVGSGRRVRKPGRLPGGGGDGGMLSSNS